MDAPSAIQLPVKRAQIDRAASGCTLGKRTSARASPRDCRADSRIEPQRAAAGLTRVRTSKRNCANYNKKCKSRTSA